jgi:hypothetical protein
VGIIRHRAIIDVAVKPVHPATFAAVGEEIKQHHTGREKGAEKTKIFTIGKKKETLTPEKANNRTGYLMNMSPA